MRSSLTTWMVGITGVLIGAGFVFFLKASPERAELNTPGVSERELSLSPEPIPVGAESFDDPNSANPSDLVFAASDLFDGTIFTTAQTYTGPIRDETNLGEWRDAIAGRARRGISALRVQFEALPTADHSDSAQEAERAQIARSIALLYLYDGNLAEAEEWIERALEVADRAKLPPVARGNLLALSGIIGLRQGEVENCVACLGPSSCIFPISAEAVHKEQAGSKRAIERFSQYLRMWPGDLRVRWLLNIAYMTLGEYPDKVPPKYLIEVPKPSHATASPRFDNVAISAGLAVRGPGQAGGAIFDDFNGDFLEDLFISSFDPLDGPSLYVNRGDGTFENRSNEDPLSEQIYALNVRRADYDNDGDLDLLLLRGGWENPVRMSLLRNKGDATFEDVTAQAGLLEPIASETAEWGDFDNDGLLDLYVCGEYLPPFGLSTGNIPDPRNLGRLYHNKGDGTFEDVAAKAGVLNEQCGKGAAWGDIDEDGDVDLFVSNMGGPNRLYRNEGSGTFKDVASEAGVQRMPGAFTCFFWDFDNDGHLDLFVSDYKASHGQAIAGFLGMAVDPDLHPRLYHNRGDGTFEDVAVGVGLDRPIAAMAANCGDIDNDGDLDLQLGTGFMSYSGLIPDMTWLNEGKRLLDVTSDARTGHLQKGHGVCFADYDRDGDLDLFAALGGGYPGDRGYYALFKNAGNGKHWLNVRLVGTKSNRSAIGARLHAEVERADGSKQSIHRQIGSNGSFGGNSLAELIGLGEADSLARLSIKWPSGQTQIFEKIPADQVIIVTEGDAEYRNPAPKSDANTNP
jgi:tetratricopeptide (TPR) repeat protein